ncbi:MAG: T9SS type A sorting domain-containing protein [Saprospiraceae bacterium]|nr:T9SS type A sorting domain-containing protein [Saprospiraceae bacterium]
MLHRCQWFMLFVLSFQFVQSQSFQYQEVPFVVNGKNLLNPGTGGLNNAQVSQADLDLDGVDDLIVFDRSGNVVVPYIFNPITSKYEYRQHYKSIFPAIEDWMIAKDYNLDGIVDLFCSSARIGVPGIEVYKGFVLNGKLQFQLHKTYRLFNALMWPTGNDKYTQIPVDFTDLPAIDDVDMDGDLDIMSFEPGGSRVYYFKNISVERGWGTDSLYHVLESLCYGGFVESGLNSDIKLSGSIDTCANYLQNPDGTVRHAGSTLLSLDLDNNGLRDLLVGDLSSDQTVALFNNGRKDKSWMTRQETSWPAASVSVNIPRFVGLFEADVDHDGLKDVLVAPNQRGLTKNTENLWFYKKRSAQANVEDFAFVQEDFLVNEILDFGSVACPVFMDYNQDGLMDLLVGTEGIYLSGNKLQASLILFENKGSRNNPVYHLVDSNYLDFRRFSTGDFPSYSFTPTFGDLDSDGDLDLLVGEHDGYLYYCQNIAGAGNPFEFAQPIFGYMDIDAKQQACPWLVDLNEDGLLDLVIGTQTGNNNLEFEPCSSFFYYENIGTQFEAKFDPDFRKAPNTACLGHAIIPGIGSQMYSSPRIYKFRNEYKMLAGSLLGKISLLENINGNINDSFKIINSDFGQIREGSRTHMDLYDVDADGILEMVVGNIRGGINFYKTNLNVDGTYVSTLDNSLNAFEIYPIPASDRIIIKSENPLTVTIELIDLYGRVAFRQNLNGENEIQIPDQLLSGWYMLRINDGKSNSVQKIVISK